MVFIVDHVVGMPSFLRQDGPHHHIKAFSNMGLTQQRDEKLHGYVGIIL
jgi:hypothetical protein